MVYGGKPSRGCQMCRIRRIKCDETRPTCHQCIKGRRECPGYKDPVGEPEHVRHIKANKAASKNIAPKQSHGERGPLKGRASFEGEDAYIEAPPQLPLEDLASCHFIAHYVLIPRQSYTTTRGFLEFVLPLLSTDDPRPYFDHAFMACALASLNNRVGTGNDFDKEALGQYTKALAAVAVALKDPEVIRRDDLLASILLLSLFENITAKTLGMLAWSSHIEGAIQLVKARGKEQLKTKTGMDLFVAVRTQMIIHSLSTGKAPVDDIDWWVNDPEAGERSSEFQELSMRVGSIKSEVNEMLASITRNKENTEVMNDMIGRCKSLDKEITDWLRDLPVHWHWDTAAWEPYRPKTNYAEAEVFPGRIDNYGDLWIVNLWNVMRCMRIVLASLIIRCTAWVIFPADYRTSPEYATTAKTCVDAIADIIASVPYQMGIFTKRKDLAGKIKHSAFGCGEDSSEKGLAGYFLLWPLTCIQGQDYLTDAQRTWVKGRLQSIGSQLGVRYGNMLSQLNVRVPSMLILRDRLKNNPNNIPIDIAAMLSGRAPGPAAPAVPAVLPPGVSIPGMPPRDPPSPEQEEAIRKKILQRQTQELVTKAVTPKGKVDDWTVKQWLQL